MPWPPGRTAFALPRKGGSAGRALWRWGGPPLAAGAVAGAAWRRRALTADGAVAATAVGAVVLGRGGLPAAAALLAFFVTGSALSRCKADAKARWGVLAQAKGGQRDAWQVLANGGVAAACLGLGGRRARGAFLGALATAGADTWATELGLLATRPPRLLTTLRPVAPGTSGAVTPEGVLAAVAGAATVGAAWAVGRRWGSAASPPGPPSPREGTPAAHIPTGTTWTRDDPHPAPPADSSARLRPSPSSSPPAGRALTLAVLSGTLGALFDSLLGATVQATYWCPHCQEPTEARRHPRCGRATVLVGGWGWLGNDAVNALATTTGALLGAAVAG